MKPFLLGTLVAAVFSASAAAQSEPQPTHAEQVQHWAEVGIDTQLKSMKTSLHLSADQEALWAPFEAAVKDGAKARVLALQKEQSDKLSPMDRNLAKAERIAQGQATIETMVDAAKPLYAILNETQKHQFVTLGRMLVPERGQFVKAMRRLH
jgi:LTXXQ motif family protein